MTDNAARMLMAGMLAIAVAILLSGLLSGGLYAPVPMQQVAVGTVNKLTGQVQICGTEGCSEPDLERP